MSRTKLALSLLAALAFTAPGLARAEMITFNAKMSADTEVPPNPSKGTGEGKLVLDTTTKTATYTVTYSGLTGPATMAHIHGPAAVGANAPVLFPFASAASPATGTITLTDAQIADLMAGKYYFNVHTAENKGGEIRGWLAR